MNNPIIEACVETLKEAVSAEQNGAHRLELCSRLDLDGLTPDIELTKQVLEKVSIPVKVMIRTRGGDFVYSDEEIESMKNEISIFKMMGVQGVVFGMLMDDNNLNLDQIKQLAELASPLEVTIHKAIDETPDILSATIELIEIGNITSILSSGGASTAIKGKEILRKMIETTGASITIIPAGSITDSNLNQVHQLIRAREYHGRRIVGQL